MSKINCIVEKTQFTIGSLFSCCVCHWLWWCVWCHDGGGRGKSFWYQCTCIFHPVCLTHCYTIFLMLSGPQSASLARRGILWDTPRTWYRLIWDLVSVGGSWPPFVRMSLSDPLEYSGFICVSSRTVSLSLLCFFSSSCAKFPHSFPYSVV